MANDTQPLEWISAADVQPEEVRWLWYPYVPAGKVTMLEGDPGLGKSWITVALASAISTGSQMPGERSSPRVPQYVLMMSAEDGLADTMRPRLDAMQADLTKVRFPPRHFILDPRGLRLLESAMDQFAAAIVFIDPIQAYTGGEMDINRANEVREIMGALAMLAERSGCAIVVVRHLRKAQGGKAIYRGLGSIDFTASVRSVVQVEEGKTGVRFMRHVKCNLAPLGAAISYSLAEGNFAWGDTYEDEDGPKASSQQKVAKVQEWLFGYLRGGSRPALDVIQAAAKLGFGSSLLTRAKKGLVRSVKDGVSGQWSWQLLEAEGTAGEQLRV